MTALLREEPRIVDNSYHNDVCPRFSICNPEGFTYADLWVAHPDEDKRETSTSRYLVTRVNELTNDPDPGEHNVVLYDGDDAAAAVAAMRDCLDRIVELNLPIEKN